LEEKYYANQYHMVKISIMAVLAGFLFYSIAGIFGILAYPLNILDNIMLSMGHSVAVDILLVSMVISVILGYPFTVFPCRQSIDQLLFPKREPHYLRTAIETLVIIVVSYCIAAFVSSNASL
jgi:amino acid permease